jgi:thioredoxin 1
MEQTAQPWRQRQGRGAQPGSLEICTFCHNLSSYRLTTTGQHMASDLIKHITDQSFETDVLQSGTPVLVDYWAEWCGPCKMIAPILDDVANGYQGKLQIAKMNVDENRDIPAKFGIRGIPTLMLFKDGQLAATKVGALSKAQLTEFIDQQLA